MRWVASASLTAGLCCGAALAGAPNEEFRFPALAFAARAPATASAAVQAPLANGRTEAGRRSLPADCTKHREVDSTFNVREANPDVVAGEFEVEAGAQWATLSRSPDLVAAYEGVAYGLTDDFFVQFDVDEPYIGQGGGSGAGDTHVAAFWRFLRGCGYRPSMALLADVRAPSGDESSGVDGTLTGMVTECVTERFRVHFNGWAQTANGDQGLERFDRRHFQWAVGPGMDYQVGKGTVLVANYLNYANPADGQPNANVIEFGVAHDFGGSRRYTQAINVAVDIGVDGRQSTPNMGVKVEYQFSIK